jgi:dTDP-4-dehydrorhamnose reductase
MLTTSSIITNNIQLMNSPILVTGLNGLIGSRINELLGSHYQFIDISRSSGVDITDSFAVEHVIDESPADTIIHLAAKTNVDDCEDDRMFGEEGESWQVNVVGTEHIATAAKKSGKRVLYISTDFVFDGAKEYYTEEDEPNPINWYGETKLRGEEILQESGADASILRISYPYRGHFPAKKDFVRVMIDKLQKKEPVTAVTDHIFTPTFIDDIALVIDDFLQRDLQGVYHVVGGSSMSVYDGIHMIAKTFGFDESLIHETTRSEFFRNRAFRPFTLALKNDKITELGIRMMSFEDGLKQIREQINVTN